METKKAVAIKIDRKANPSTNEFEAFWITTEAGREYCITKDNLENLMCSMLEGGIGYWAMLDNTTEDWRATKLELKARRHETPTLEEIAVKLLTDGKKIDFLSEEDHENDVPETEWEQWKMTAENLLQAIVEWGEAKQPTEEGQIPVDDADAEDADRIAQMALFGEEIYG